MDVETPAGRIFKRLATQLHDRRVGRQGSKVWHQRNTKPLRIRPGVQRLDDYLRGEPPLDRVANEWKAHVREFIRKGSLNAADLLISSTANRMNLRDFRTAAADDEMGDQRARELMRLNGMSVKIREVHECFLAHADAYAIVTPPSSARPYPLMTAEDALQTITHDDPATGESLAGLKMFRDEWDTEDVAYLHLPGKVLVARKPGRTSITDGGMWSMSERWYWDEEMSQDVPDGRLAIVHFRNRFGRGEYEGHLPTLDRINDKVASEWWLIKIQAHRQRAIKGLPETDEQGNEVDYTDVFVSAPDALWQVPADAEFWESSPADISQVTNAVKHDLERLAATTSTMLHTITPDAASGSAEGAALLREEHTFKVEDRRDRVASPWAGVMELMFAFSDEPEDKKRADRSQIEPIWGPLQRFSLTEKADASAKATGTLPTESIWTDIWQYPPAEVQNLRTLRGRDLLFQQPTPPPPAS
ncbi:phage portal protein [Mumia sp. DW29H23]|uniref:phage portal protein n=1 Tax=Mumia sp. DW29H23 TaxID=3421241 RepID=UPI003D6962E3